MINVEFESIKYNYERDIIKYTSKFSRLLLIDVFMQLAVLVAILIMSIILKTLKINVIFLCGNVFWFLSFLTFFIIFNYKLKGTVIKKISTTGNCKSITNTLNVFSVCSTLRIIYCFITIFFITAKAENYQLGDTLINIFTYGLTTLSLCLNFKSWETLHQAVSISKCLINISMIKESHPSLIK